MNRILDIGHNDLRLFLRNKAAYIWLFLMPLAFVYFMSFANRGPGDPANRRPAVLIENGDTNFLGRLFLEELNAQGMRLVDPTNAQTAARGIRIPPDFTSRVLRQEQTKVQFFRGEDSGEADAAIIELRLVRALIAMNGHLLEAATRADAPATLTGERIRKILTSPSPVTLESRFAGRKPVPSGVNFSLPGNLVMYLMMNLLIFGGSSVASERRNGVMKRFLVFPVKHAELVIGKIYGLILLGAAQILFLLVVGKFAFRVNLGANLPAVMLILLTFAWAAGSLGVLAGSLIAAEDRVIGICVLVSLLMAAIGGCWWPLEIAPPTIQTLSLCVPTGWALKALHQLISFGSGFGAAMTPLAVLVCFGAVANVLAVRLFRS